MSLHSPASDPPMKLGVYRVLSAQAGVRISPMMLDAMSVINCFKLLDPYFDMGGNFIDTANGYQDGSSKEFIGEFNYVRNSSKSLYLSVEPSLKKLHMDYSNILYLHWWDCDTSIHDLMDNLHYLVSLRKVLYLGISDAPAWVVAQANQCTLDYRKKPFLVYQGWWNIMMRSFEREIILMTRVFGMALVPWDVLTAGRFRTDEEDQKRKETGEKGRTISHPDWERNEFEIVASEVGVQGNTNAGVRNRYVMHKTPYVFPIIGGRKFSQAIGHIEILIAHEHSLEPE
ncbi:NADP-dependent oxidoreductase domain-containing protein [Desarmillaria tabescens]|uniref:NADP-dependent oxidoreductase domain-containing protein n=1 Tax=Armillaria tabescens TaxID=1929756 RepID=A0AA39JV24_ARMTA|nr:NADP-dependent oxidoreductase domain-containing protein [Desarmillaria tabescens]KAK0448410.1 NADP-dependent oxidoreductase domain-containing protein [Desarmillaria tabescens]